MGKHTNLKFQTHLGTLSRVCVPVESTPFAFCETLYGKRIHGQHCTDSLWAADSPISNDSLLLILIFYFCIYLWTSLFLLVSSASGGHTEVGAAHWGLHDMGQ